MLSRWNTFTAGHVQAAAKLLNSAFTTSRTAPQHHDKGSIDPSDSHGKPIQMWGNPESDVEPAEETARKPINTAATTLGLTNHPPGGFQKDVAGHRLDAVAGARGMLTKEDIADLDRPAKDLSIEEMADKVVGGEPAHFTHVHKMQDSPIDKSQQHVGSDPADPSAGNPQGYVATGPGTTRAGNEHYANLEFERRETVGPEVSKEHGGPPPKPGKDAGLTDGQLKPEEGGPRDSEKAQRMYRALGTE